MKKRLYLLLVGVMSLFLFVACGDNSTKTDAKKGPKDTIVVAQGADAKSLDPHGTNDQPSSRISAQIYDRLVEQDNDMKIVPGLAESWEQVDPKTVVFHLRKGVKFHNGEPLKASDVKFSLERMKNSPKVSYIIGAVDTIDVIDDNTVKITTTEPFGPLLNHLAHNAASILNEKAVKEAGESYGQHPVGTGPYKFVAWQSGDRVEMEANPDYFLGETPIKNLTFRAITEDSNRTIALETGEIDIAYDIQGLDKDRLKASENIKFIEEPSLGIGYLGFNTRKKPFDNPKVREAIAYAINADDIIDAAYKGSATKANSLIGPKVFGHSDKPQFHEYNIEKAKQLLAEAGYPNGFKTKIWINDNPVRRDIAAILQDQLKQVGIEASVETLEWGAYLEGTARGDHDMFILGWVTVTGDADYGLYPLLHPSSFGGAGNRAFYENPKVTELLEKARTSVDQNERKELYEQIQIIAQQDLPYYVLCFQSQNAAMQKDVQNFNLRPAGHHKLYGVEFKEEK